MRALLHLVQNLNESSQMLRQACVDLAFKKLTQAMNVIYVRQTFPNGTSAREDVLDLFDSIKDSFKETLRNLTWLDEDTRDRAVEKVGTRILSQNSHAHISSAD